MGSLLVMRLTFVYRPLLYMYFRHSSLQRISFNCIFAWRLPNSIQHLRLTSRWDQWLKLIGAELGIENEQNVLLLKYYKPLLFSTEGSLISCIFFVNIINFSCIYMLNKYLNFAYLFYNSSIGGVINTPLSNFLKY